MNAEQPAMIAGKLAEILAKDGRRVAGFVAVALACRPEVRAAFFEQVRDRRAARVAECPFPTDKPTTPTL